jgi:hypothetical protein
MDDRGQVFFDAGDKEIPSEAKARYEAAHEEAGEQDVIQLLREYYRELAKQEWERQREPSDKERAHIEKRTRFEEALKREAQARFGENVPEKE